MARQSFFNNEGKKATSGSAVTPVQKTTGRQSFFGTPTETKTVAPISSIRAEAEQPKISMPTGNAKPAPAKPESFFTKAAKAVLPKSLEDFFGLNESQTSKDVKSGYEEAYATTDLKKLKEEVKAGGGKLPKLTAKEVLKKTPVEKYLPFFSAVPDIVNSYQIFQSAKRLERGENTAIDDYRLAKFSAEAQRDKTFISGVVGVLTELPSFAGELFFTGGIYTAAKKATEKVITKTIATTAEKSVLRATTERLLTKAAGTVVGGTVQTLPARAVHIPASTIQNMTPGYSFQPDEKGNFATFINKDDPGDPLWKAAALAFTDQWVEVVSEHSGGIFNEITGPLKNKLLKLGIFNAFRKSNPTATSLDFMKFVRQSGWNGTLAEMGEEWIGIAMRGGLTQVGLSKDGWRIPSKEELAVQLVAFSIPGMTIGIANKALQGAGSMEDDQQIPEEPQGPKSMSEAENIIGSRDMLVVGRGGTDLDANEMTALKSRIENYHNEMARPVIEIKTADENDLASIKIVPYPDGKWGFSYEINTAENGVSSDFLNNTFASTREGAIDQAKNRIVDYIMGEMPNVSDEVRGDFESIMQYANNMKPESEDGLIYEKGIPYPINRSIPYTLVDVGDEDLNKEIEKRVEKFRKEAGLMASREGAGVRQYTSDQTGGENRVYNYFKKSRAGADMKKRKEYAQKYATQLLYENDPEFKELVDKRDKLLEDKLDLPADEISEEYINSIFSEVSDEEAKINEANQEFSEAGEVEEDQRESDGQATREKVQEIAKQYGNKKLISELKDLESEAIEYAVENEDQIIADYIEKNGNVLMGDAIKEFLPKYSQNRDKYVAYKAASNYIWNKLFDKFLVENKNVGNGIVSIMMGGQGSGKTASIEAAFEINPAADSAFSIESLMADEAVSKKTLDRIIENGYRVNIYHVASKATDAYDRVIARARKSGRVVPIDYFVTGHKGAALAGIQLSKNTENEKITYFLIDNRTPGVPGKLVNEKSEELAVLRDIGYSEDEANKAKKELYDYTNELYQQKEISKDIFRGQTGYYEGGTESSGDQGSKAHSSITRQAEGNTVDFNLKKEKPLTKQESGFVLPKKEGAPQALFAKKWQVKMAKEMETPKTVDKTTIMAWVEKAFGVPLKGKATHKWRASGIYYPNKQIIRMQKWGELSVLTHEVAHHIDKLLKNSTQLGYKWRNKNQTIIKELASLDYEPEKRRTSEGFAEYIRHKMTTGLEKEKAPAFDKFFNEEFLAKKPELKGRLDKMKELMDTWAKQGAENRIIKQIDWKQEHTKAKGIMPKIKKAWGFVQKKFNDEFYTPQRIVKEIQRTIGRKLKPTENPAIMMEYSKSKAGAVARTFVMDKAIDEYGNVTGPGLVDILKPIPNSEMKQFIAYAVSLRAINLEGRDIESGIDIDDAKFMVEKYKNRGWDAQAQGLTQWSNHLLDWLIRAGGLTGEVATKMRDLNPVYLPFKRAFLDAAGVFKGGSGFVDTGAGLKGIKGSGRPIINPIESMIAQSREMIAKAQKIRIAKIFADLSQEENIGGFITKVPAPMKATRFEASQINDYILKTTGQLPDAGVNDFLTVFTQDFKYNGKENIVTIWQNGKQEFYEIHPDLYEAFKGIDPLKLGPIAKVLAPFSRMLRLGATGLKFSFGLARNPFRDALTYAVFSKRKGATIFDPIKGIYTDLTTKEGEATWRFKKLGGALSGQIGFDRAATQSTYDELLLEKLGKKGKVLKIVKHPINTLRDLLSVTEMGPRSAELETNYKKYLAENKDWSEEDAFVQAFNDAQDVTVNFTKSGKWAKQINEVTAFFNVSIRGPEKTYRSFRERPIQTTIKGILWLTLIALASWYRNKDKDWYRNLPPAYKYNNLFFEIGDNVFRLPIPFELGTIFMSAPQAMLDTYRDKDIKWMKGLLDVAKSQIPDPVPSAFQGAIDVATNKNYLGLPIESEGMQYLYPTERKRDYTSKFAIAVSKGLDKIGVQLSPIQLDYLLDSYSGGFLRQFRVSSEELSGLPVISDLMLQNKDYPRRQLNEFFADYELLTQKKAAEVASEEELEKLDEVKSFYKYYSDISDDIKEAKKEKNEEKIKQYILEMRDGLKEYGYD